MSIKQTLKKSPTIYNAILAVLNSINYFTLRFNIFFPKYKVSNLWKERLETVKQSDDNQHIHHHPYAGKIFKDYQIMHNGLKIVLGSYYDYGNVILLRENKGVHEPQEEYAFQEVLKTLPEDACMMELGSYWAFYSMWLASSLKKAQCIMVEPDPHKMNFGKLNFKLNKLKGKFELGFIDDRPNFNSAIPSYSVDFLIKKHKIDFLHVLHSDIQGYEYKMLQGANSAIQEQKIGYIFISTHSNELHYKCQNFLTNHNFNIVCSADLNESYSWDGLLVGKSKSISGLESLSISKRAATPIGFRTNND